MATLPGTTGPATLDPHEIARIQDEVRALARERQALIVAPNYELPEIQDVADFVRDSLSRKAAKASWS